MRIHKSQSRPAINYESITKRRRVDNLLINAPLISPNETHSGELAPVKGSPGDGELMNWKNLKLNFPSFSESGKQNSSREVTIPAPCLRSYLATHVHRGNRAIQSKRGVISAIPCSVQ